MVQTLRDETETEQELLLVTDSDKATTFESESELHEDTLAVGYKNDMSGSQDKIWSRS
jgi:hypothetical protein